MAGPSKFMLESRKTEPSLLQKSIPFLSHAYTKFSTVSRNNLFKQIRHQIVLLYCVHYILYGFMLDEVFSSLATGTFFIIFLLSALQHSINDILHHINGALFVIFGLLLFSDGNYAHKIGMYLPQLSLLVTNNIHFAGFLQSFMLFTSIVLRLGNYSPQELYTSTMLLTILIIILEVRNDANLRAENLKANVDSMEAQLQSAQTRLEESRLFNKDFHLTISHEFRNPLNNVMGNLDLVQKSLPPEDTNQENLKMAKLGCEILLNSLNNTLDYCKTEFDEIDINYVSCNIRKCLEKSWVMLSELLRLRNLQGELYLHASVPPLIMLDPGRLQQILLNLTHNASKFTSKGYVKIIISWHPCIVANNEASLVSQLQIAPQNSGSSAVGRYSSQPQLNQPISRQRNSTPDTLKRTIDPFSYNEDEFSEYPCNSHKITFSPSMNYVKLDSQTKRFPKGQKRRMPFLTEGELGFLKIQVIDSGVGIHQSNLPKLFQKFSKFSHDAMPRVEGSGLGLWVTKQICSKMEGTIHVHSDLNKGSTFLVFLKCEISPQSLGTPTPSPALSDRRNRANLQSMGSNPFFGLKPASSTIKDDEPKKENQVSLRAMVVDDIPYNQHLNKKFLEVCGVEVKHIAENGLDAYKKYVASNKEPLDLIFMDLDMPVMDGKTSSSKIREWEKANKAKAITIVILTGNCSEEELRLCLDKTGTIKADYFYRKPLSLSDCQNLIQLIKREKVKKKTLIANLPVIANYILLYENDLFQQVLLENYLKVGQIKYYIANKANILDKFTKHCDLVGVILYNCENVDENFQDLKTFVDQVKSILKRKGKKEIPILGIVKEFNRDEIARLKSIGFRDFLVKPFDYENIIKLLRAHTVNGLPL